MLDKSFFTSKIVRVKLKASNNYFAVEPYPLHGRRNMKRKYFKRFALVLVAAILVCAIFEQIECSFKAKNFPINQPGTVWSSDDGAFTISVSDEVAISKSNRVQRYAYEAYMMWNGEQYSASFGFDSAGYIPLIKDGRSPHHVDLCLEDSEGVIIEVVSCKYYMPNKHTLKLTPVEPLSTAPLSEALVLSRIDP